MHASVITEKIINSLRNPAAYPVATGSVELIQTHVSWLFLTDTHVFKIKKPVNFGFLDFSTLELRRFYCHEELRLNRRLCPDIYEQVITLHEAGSGATFWGTGAIIEYAVMMKRLPADRMLDRLVECAAISVGEIQSIACEISTFHSHARTSAHISTFGSLEQICFNWQESFDQTVQFQELTLPLKLRKNICRYVESFIADHGDLLHERVRQGYIRECDGDIHLGNICLVDKTAYIFDCIEFNERFRCSDTVADISFLLMDLDCHRRPDLAAAALSAYMSASGDTGIAGLVLFYKVYRAFVRGKVESMQLLDGGIDEETRRVATKRAINYFRLAQGYSIRGRIPVTLFITCGTMGCGKSTLAGQLAFELGTVVCNSDVVRKQLAGVAPETSVPVPFGEGLYSVEMTRATYSHLILLAGRELAAGHSVIIDAGFGTRALRAECARLAAFHTAGFVILYVQCDQDEQRLRLGKRSSRGGSESDGRVELLDRHVLAFVPPDESEGTVIPVCANDNSGYAMDTVYETLMQ